MEKGFALPLILIIVAATLGVYISLIGGPKLPIYQAPLPSPVAVPTDGCRVTGCSGQVCADEEVITICEWKEEYECYRNSRCERQPDGKCGWTQTPKLIE